MKYYTESQEALLIALKSQGDILLTDDNKHDANILQGEELVSIGFYGRTASNRTDKTKYIRLMRKGEVYLSTKGVDDHRYNETVAVAKRANRISIIAIILASLSLLWQIIKQLC